MRYAKIILGILGLLGVCAPGQEVSSQPPARGKRIVIAASVLLDGKGGVLRNTRIVIDGARIVALDPGAGPVDYDLRGLTVMPGWIDSHVHITSSFGRDGRFGGEATPEESSYQTASNAWLTLMGGFTTVQTMSQAVTLRDYIAKGLLPGPRILTVVLDLTGRGEQTGTPEEIRAYVRKQKEAGADLIKIYASGGMRSGAKTLSQEQLNAACDEAKKQGLRTHVHAYRDAVAAATLAGCTQVEHGLGATDDDLRLMAEKGIYLDPQGGALLKNYTLNKARYAGAPFFPKTEEELVASIESLLPMHHELI
ncbi:MAG TPA: amidohydrolase family protein, partial [Blastocatellia bacterium]|nr:amidohydrolase family protein [Blastocatellia bacterium]